MERNSEFSPYSQFEGMDNGINDMYKDPMFNPIMQYEQAYSYYKYLSDLKHFLASKIFKSIDNALFFCQIF